MLFALLLFAVTPDEKIPQLRLPADVEPLRVDLDLTLDPNATKLAGVIGFDLEIARATRVLWLNANDITVASAEAQGQKARVLTVDGRWR